mmetsp:Transcript_22608/g.31508  ORF Transcript_22608/g.31508 Transcript_22608/m.31508 type:complete len:311 (+) Transcript_22608:96-1028(+)
MASSLLQFQVLSTAARSTGVSKSKGSSTASRTRYHNQHWISSYRTKKLVRSSFLDCTKDELKRTQRSILQLCSSSLDESKDILSSENISSVRDTKAVLLYVGATSVQWVLLIGSLWALQALTGYLDAAPGVSNWVSKVLVIGYFGSMSLKSRVFSFLNNSRPTVDKDGKKMSVMDGVIRPSWMPPPLAFPIIWSTITLLRTASSVIIWEACGRSLLVPPIMMMMLHLSIGDTWNTINNVERRKGTAVVGVLFVWISVIVTVKLFFDTDMLAGIILAPSAAWLTIASFLVYTIWDLNGRDSLYPMKEADEL